MLSQVDQSPHRATSVKNSIEAAKKLNQRQHDHTGMTVSSTPVFRKSVNHIVYARLGVRPL
jgi:hypothetical protein